MTGADFMLASTAGNAALISFALYMVVVFVLAGLANREQSGKSFLNEYFLGSRNLGMWAFAFTYAATSASGGSFMGFPSLIYTHGWVMALWIAGYIIVPLVAIGLIAKRLNQVARKSGSITVPELLRKRLGSGTVGAVATVLLVFFQFFFLLAQFKAGAKIMTTLLGDVEVYQTAVAMVDRFTAPIPWVARRGGLSVVPPGVCRFGGGVHGMGWLSRGGVDGHDAGRDHGTRRGDPAGACAHAGRRLEQRDSGTLQTGAAARWKCDLGPDRISLVFSSGQGTWLEMPAEEKRQPFVRLKEVVEFSKGQTEFAGVPVIEVRTSVENATELKSIRAQVKDVGVSAQAVDVEGYKYGDDKPGVYVSAPGPKSSSGMGFLPIMLAVSFFCFWPFAGAAQPSYMARQMAFKDIPTLRHSIIFVALYFSLIYFPLIIIFTCGRVLLPGWEIDADRVMPEMATFLTSTAGVPWLAGLLVAAPFAAVMSSVDSFLLLVSGSVVRDVYQRKNPKASEAQMKKVTYWTTVGVGAMALFAMLNPPQFLQDLIVFGSGGLGASFLMPVILTLYWPDLTPRATVAGMLSGGGTMAVFYLIGYLVHDKFSAYELLSLHPFIWSVLVSALVMLAASKGSRPTDPKLVKKYFGNVGNEEGKA